MDTAQSEQIAKIFMPRARRQRDELIRKNHRLVHYTSAAAAVSILKTREVWLRSVATLNDYSEVRHGLDCLRSVYKETNSGAAFKAAIKGVFPDILKELEEIFDSWSPYFAHDTYIISLSEHAHDDVAGRLSMWRAYGGKCGVAIILNPAAFVEASNVLKAYSVPAIYSGIETFAPDLNGVASAIHQNRDLLQSLGPIGLRACIFNMLRFTVLGLKHPSFSEESEWRVVYTPKLDTSQHLTSSVEVVRDVPQVVWKIPLRVYPEFAGASIPNLIERIIIGPTDFADSACYAFIKLLEDAGVPDAAKKVCCSPIPLR